MIDYYSQNAQELYSEYRRVKPEVVHTSWTGFLPSQPGLACDIGSGSGRDSDWLAEKGWDVVAVEPNKELRELAQEKCHPRVQFVDDALPALKIIRKIGHRFDLILLSAVWMHVNPKLRARAFRILVEMLAPSGLLVITLRLGAVVSDEGRGFYPVNADELNIFANDRAIALVNRSSRKDVLGREQITWETVVYKVPDDGTGALPLLRHIIVNDNKSSTYKLGLLRALIRIAEGAPGMLTKWNDDYVEIPFGLVGLYWLKLYMPLVLQNDLLQSPSRKDGSPSGYGWAKEDFYSMADMSPYDLRVGATFSGSRAVQILGAIRDACRNIQQMPVHYTTLPGGSDPVFQCERKMVRRTERNIQINKEFLSEFGVFRIPTNLWQSMGQYACWLEPAIVNEWKNLMQGWQVQYSGEKYERALQWDEGRRDTTRMRAMVNDIQQVGGEIHCVWTNSRLRGNAYEIDHCFPWSYWFNNDLWNLLPTTITANGRKSNSLPSAELMLDSRDRVLDWWEMALVRSDSEGQFYMEAEASLPQCEGSSGGVKGVFAAMQHQRLRLKKDQQLPEWFG